MIKGLENFEVEEVMDIWLKTNIEAHNFIRKQYWVDNFNVVKEQYIPNSTTYIYKEDDIIKGFISIVDEFFVGALFVLEDYQEKGIGKKLLNYCKKIYNSLELAVYSENNSAFKFYKSCNFRIKNKQVNEDSGFEEYIMIWEKE